MNKNFSVMMRFSPLITACLLLLGAMLTAGQELECPSTWVAGEQTCYKFLFDLRKTLAQAITQCEDIGAKLLSVEDDNENVFISNWLAENDQQNLEWYTSGKRMSEISDKFSWTTTGSQVKEPISWADKINTPTGNYIIYKKYDLGWGFDLTADNSTERAYICEVPKQEVTKVVVRDRDWTFGQTDLTNIEKGPKFVKQPPREVIFTSAKEYNKVEFECLASGNPAPTYSWIVKTGKTDREVTTTSSRYTLTNGKLVIHNPSTAATGSDVGQYQCVATNKFGSVLGDEVNLVYGFIGEFSKTKPKPLRKSMNEDAAIPCNPPSHYPRNINYRWYDKRATNFVRPDLKPYMFISKNGKLYFSRVKPKDEGEYYCSVSSAAISSGVGRTSVPTALIVSTGASDTRDPRIHSDFLAVFPPTPMKNDNVTIECFAAGTGDLVYSWKRLPEGRSLPPTASLHDHNRVLKIQNIRLEDAGEYECTVSMGQGTTMSKSRVLRLQSIPYFTKNLRDHHVDIGETFTLHCEADGKPRVEYSWYKNGVLLSPNSRISVNKTRVIVSNAVSEDAGMYQCAATNLHGTTFSTSQVRVMAFAPSFAKYPMDPIKYAALDGSVTLICAPEAAPEPSRVWIKDGRQLSLSKNANDRMYLLNNGNLMIKRVVPSDEGNYTCKVTNRMGSAASSGRVIVLTKTEIAIPPLSQLAVINSTINLDCEALVHPSLDFTYLWLFNGYRLDLDFNGDRRLRQYRNLEHYSRGTGSRWGDLVIRNMTYAQAGIYTCVALTPQDSAQKSANITVVGPPGQPAEVNAIATSITATSLTLRWSEANKNGNTIISYKIQGRSNHRDYWHDYNMTGTSELGEQVLYFPGIRQTSLVGLDAWSSYKFRVIAVNDYGEGEPSEPSAEYTTQQTRPMTAPRNIRKGQGKEGTLVILWDGLLSAEINGPGMGYKLQWRPKASPDTDKPTVRELEGNVTKYTHVVGTANYFTPYMVQVAAYNTAPDGRKRYGQPSAWTEVYSADKMPPHAPENVRARGVNSTCIEVTWNPIEDTKKGAGGKIIGYRINYWRREGETEARDYRRQTIMGQTDRGRIIGLEPNTYYEVNVMVFNSAGNGPRSSPYWERTWRKAPQDPPRELRIERLSETSIFVHWRGVGTRKDEEPVEGYHIRNWPVGEAMTNIEPLDVGKVTQFTLKNLEKETRYYLRVYAYSRGGHGKMSSPLLQYQLGPGPFLRMMPLPPCNAFPGYRCSASGLVPNLAVTIVVALVAKLFNRIL